MRLLCAPSWSFGRSKRLLSDCRDALTSLPLVVHYCSSDIDLNRTKTVFSGEEGDVLNGLSALCDLVLPGIDLNRHASAYPRVGGLDTCPFVALDPPRTKLRAQRLRLWVEGVAKDFADKFQIPVFLSDKSEKNRRESELPDLRRGGFGGLLGQSLNPDFGPSIAHPNLGATFMGWKDFYMCVNVHLACVDPGPSQRIAQQIREARNEGDPRMLGVRAMGFALPSRELSVVSLQVMLPDLTPIDSILEFVSSRAEVFGVETASCEVAGAIRDSDLQHATRLHPRQEQVVTFGVKV